MAAPPTRVDTEPDGADPGEVGLPPSRGRLRPVKGSLLTPRAGDRHRARPALASGATLKPTGELIKVFSCLT
jgi:hypothetical protein